MSCFSEVEEFVKAHRPCGRPTWWADQPTPEGYRVRIACPCGVLFGRWVFPQDAEEDLVQSRLLSFPN